MDHLVGLLDHNWVSTYRGNFNVMQYNKFKISTLTAAVAWRRYRILIYFVRGETHVNQLF
jgi:hypothetical protein